MVGGLVGLADPLPCAALNRLKRIRCAVDGDYFGVWLAINGNGIVFFVFDDLCHDFPPADKVY